MHMVARPYAIEILMTKWVWTDF